MQQRLSPSVRWTLSASLVAAGAGLLSAHPAFVAMAGARGAYPLGTILLLTVAILLVIVWPRSVDAPPSIRPHLPVLLLTVTAGLVPLYGVASELLRPVFAGPLDPLRADMLVIMEHAIRKLVAGENPYAVHKVPWDAPLTYGPMLWLPHVVSYVLRFDFRIFTLVAQLVIPVLCLVAAGVRAGQRDVVRATVLFALGVGLALHPGMRSFHQVGHTQVYWPGLALFCLLLRLERWTAAAVCLGLLMSARTPLLSLAPVFLLYLHARQALTLRRCFALGAAILGPFLPFLLVDFRAVKDGMFDTYVRVMKTYVWQSTPWAVDTYGITGRLLEHGKQAYVEVVQLLSLSIVYLTGWRVMTRGGRAEPWLGLALMTFAMTTLWSVLYLYYDVWLLLTCGLLACDGSWEVLTGRRPVRALAAAFAIAAALVVTSAAMKPGDAFTLDVGSPAAAGYTGGGFGNDLSEEDEGRHVVWIEGATARIRLPRAAWTGGHVLVGVRPHVPYPGARQGVTASLNGQVLGRAELKEGWQEVTFATKRRQWLYGFNVLDLQFSYAAPRESPSLTGKDYAAAIDFVTVER